MYRYSNMFSKMVKREKKNKLLTSFPEKKMASLELFLSLSIKTHQMNILTK